MPLTILSVGADASLLRSRAAVLGTTGTKVTAADPVRAEVLLREKHFDLAVLCHSLSTAQVMGIMQAARSHRPVTRVLLIDSPFVEADRSDFLSGDDFLLDSSGHPAAMVAMVRRILDLPVLGRA